MKLDEGNDWTHGNGATTRERQEASRNARRNGKVGRVSQGGRGTSEEGGGPLESRDNYHDDLDGVADALRGQGSFFERIAFRDRAFFPTGVDELKTFERVVKAKPVVNLFDRGGKGESAGGPGGDASFSRQSGIGSPSHRSAVEYIAKPLLDGLRNAPQLRVVQSANQLPVTAPADAQGMYLKGVVWLVANNLVTPADVRNTVTHEIVGHCGIRRFFGSMHDFTFYFIHGANPKI